MQPFAAVLMQAKPGLRVGAHAIALAKREPTPDAACSCSARARLAGAMDEIQELSNATCMARAPIVRIDVAGTKIDVFFVPVLFV